MISAVKLSTSDRPATAPSFTVGAARLTPAQVLKAIALGLVFQFCAAMIVRFGTLGGFLDGPIRVLTFVLILPLSWATVWLVKRVVGIQAPLSLAAVAIGTAAASFCDGIALTWVPSLYARTAAQVLSGAALILWGVAWVLAIAYLDSYRSQGRPAAAPRS